MKKKKRTVTNTGMSLSGVLTMEKMHNWYETHPNLLHELVEEKFNTVPDITLLTKKHLIQAWFGAIESTGGGATANIDSEHVIEVVLYHIEKALEQLKDYK